MRVDNWPALLYRLFITVAGLGWLLWSLLQPHAPLPWGVVGIFVLVSWLVKRAGVRVTAEVTHSLVNVFDIGALLVLGLPGGAVVAALSSLLHTLFSVIRQPRWQRWEVIGLPLFDGGVKALLALIGGTLYLQLGGVLAPTSISAALVFPLAALFLVWFALDHLLWVALLLLQGGILRARAFLWRVFRVSLVLELAPLPFAIVFAAAWVRFDLLLRVLLLVGSILAALVVRGLVLSLRRAQQRLETVSLLNQFGQSLVLAQLDETKLSRLLFEFAARLLPDVRFELLLLEGEEQPPRAVLPEPGMRSRGIELISLILPLMQEHPRGRLLPELTAEELVEEARRQPGERPTRGSALIFPLLAHDDLMGIFIVESTEPDRLTLDDGRSVSVLATQATVALQNALTYRREQAQVRQLEAIAEVSRMVASVIDLDEFLWKVVNLIRDTFDYYHVQIYLVEPETEEVVYRAGSGEAGRALAERPLRLKMHREGIIGWVAGHGEPLLVNDVSRDQRYIPDHPCLLPETRAEMAVPLMIENRVLGALDVQSDRISGLSDDDCFTLATLADQVAIALEEARLHLAEREEAWLTMALLVVTEALNPLLEIEEVLETIVHVTPPLIGVDAAVIYLWNHETQEFAGAAAHGLEAETARAVLSHRVRAEEFPWLRVVRDEQRLVAVERLDQSDLVPAYLAERIREMGATAVPLQAQGAFVGVLLLGSHGKLRRLSSRRRSLAAGIAQQAAVSIQAANLHTTQREEAATIRDLLQVAERIAGRAEAGEVLELVTRLVVATTEAERCVVYLWRESEQRLEPAEAHGFAPEVEEAWRETTLAANDALFLECLRERSEPVVLGEGGALPLECEAVEVLFDSPTVVAMPLRAGDDFLGVVLVDSDPQRPYPSHHLRSFLTGVARQLSVALENAVLYEEALENERRSQELVLARQIQGALLPERAPEIPGFDIAGYWRPAREVAGDFYDFISISRNRWAFSIADVADKGIGAALFMVLARTALRESIWHEEDTARALQRTNSVIAADVRGGMFLTVFLGILSPESGHVQAANAGHFPPLVYRAESDTLTSMIQRNLPLAILADTVYHNIELVLNPGDVMVMMTDGLSDAVNPAMEDFGLGRVSELIYEHSHQSASGLIDAILDAATAHASGEPFPDDLTMVVVRRRTTAEEDHD